ncbi:MAG: YcxB family protein [Vicinamibacterales bacterium]
MRTLSMDPAGTGADELQATFTATRADMRVFQRHVTGRIRASVRTPLYWLVLILSAVLAGGVLSGGLGVRVDPASALVVAVLVPVIWWPLSRLYRLAASPGERGSLVGPRTVSLSAAGVRQVAPLHEGFTSWAGVLEVAQTRTHLFLMTDTLAGYVVPRRAFTDDAAWQAFADCARRRVEAASRPGEAPV